MNTNAKSFVSTVTGISCFNGMMVPPGGYWASAWYNQLTRCKVFVPMLSREFLRSHSCKYELQSGIGRKIEASMEIIPLFIEDVDRSDYPNETGVRNKLCTFS